MSKSFSKFWFCVNLATFYHVFLCFSHCFNVIFRRFFSPLALSHIIIFTSRIIIFLSKVLLSLFRAVLFCIISLSEVFFSFLFKSVLRFLTLTNVAFFQVSFSISCNFVTLSFPYFSRRTSTSDLFITLCSLPFLPYMFTQQHYGVRQVSCACGISLTSKMTFYLLKPLKKLWNVVYFLIWVNCNLDLIFVKVRLTNGIHEKI